MKVGVLSFAHVHATGYVKVLQAMDGVEVLAADPEPDPAAEGEVRGRELASQLGVAYADSYQEVFDWGPDAVIVTAENSRHRALVEAAAKHGVGAVLCEKPLATTAADGEAMLAACREAGTRLGVAYPVRFHPAYGALRRAVRGGSLGGVLAVAGANNGYLPTGLRRWFTDPELAGGGALMDHTVHIADLLDDLFGDDVHAEEVYAQSNNLMYADEADAETAGLVTVRYSNGTVATIDCSWSQPRSHPQWGGLELQVVGERATVEMDAFGQSVGGFDERSGRGLQLPWGVNLDELLLRSFLYREERGGVGVADGAAGLRSLKVALAARESARVNRPVAVV
ncbi:Gfo/Idh/MocA family protein [Streptomyces boninensis]|uniref:Gfo/Idh/MocA family protein n=1 Tax=Streptomyces boninensis TaxID=2039455 RepID=UPI003B21E2BC